MEKMRFHWEKGIKKGSFTVTAFSVEECIEIAKEEIEIEGGELINWYSI
jgi:hypothetical protein